MFLHLAQALLLLVEQPSWAMVFWRLAWLFQGARRRLCNCMQCCFCKCNSVPQNEGCYERPGLNYIFKGYTAKTVRARCACSCSQLCKARSRQGLSKCWIMTSRYPKQHNQLWGMTAVIDVVEQQLDSKGQRVVQFCVRAGFPGNLSLNLVSIMLRIILIQTGIVI